MSARRLLAVAVALGTLIAVGLWHSHRGHRASAASTSAATTTSRTAPSALEGSTGIADGGRAPAPTSESIERDPAAAARLWNARAWNVLYARNQKQFGDDVARLLQLPYNEAWDPLVAKAKDGNIGAATAVIQIASICNAEATRGDQAHRPEPAASKFYKELPDDWKPFIDRIGELHAHDHDRMTHCDGVGSAVDLAFTFFDQFFTADNPEAQVQFAAENKDPQQAIADLREILSRHDVPRGRTVLGDLLMQSSDETERAQGRAMLEQLAPNDVEAATRLAYCLEHGCGGAEPDPTAARTWLEQSAGLGDQLGLSYLRQMLQAQGDHAAEWAWSKYALDLALDGCFEMFQPSYMQIAGAARDETKARSALTPAEHNAGLAIGYAISGRWEKPARERLACD